jgi:TolB-like protein
MDWDNGTSESELMTYDLGVKFNISPKLTMMVDFNGDEDETLRFLRSGFELIVWESLRISDEMLGGKYFTRTNVGMYPEELSFILRGGIEKGMADTDDDLKYSGGFSIGVGGTRLDYALKIDNDNDLGNTQHFFSLGFQWGENIFREAEAKKQVDEQKEKPQLNEPVKIVQATDEKKTEVAVITFKDVSDDKKFGWLGSGIPDMIIRNLKVYQNINVKDRKTVSEMVSLVQPDIAQMSPDMASQIGILVNADLILIGTFKVLNDSDIEITYKLFNTDKRQLMLTNNVNGKLSDLFPLIDQINADVNKVAMNYSILFGK